MESSLKLINESLQGLLDRVTTDYSFASSPISDLSPDDQAIIAKLAPEAGISLLGLKNHTMLAYLHHLVGLILTGLERTTLVDTADNVEEEEENDNNKFRQLATQGAVSDRIVLEKGIKGLEARISYQIEKVLRAYQKQQAQDVIDAQRKENESDDNENNDDDDNNNRSDSDSDDDDALVHKPNPLGLASTNKDPANQVRGKPHLAMSESGDKPVGLYRPPKISAVAPVVLDDKNGSRGPGGAQAKKRRNATMDEYLSATSVAPQAEYSIGASIVDHGRGEKTAKDRKREAEINKYEEDNMIRLPGLSKKDKTKEKRMRGDAFFGEDWGLNQYGPSRGNDLNTVTKRQKSSGGASAWDRAKKRSK